MKKWLKIGLISLGSMILLFILFVAFIYVREQNSLRNQADIPEVIGGSCQDNILYEVYDDGSRELVQDCDEWDLECHSRSLFEGSSIGGCKNVEEEPVPIGGIIIHDPTPDLVDDPVYVYCSYGTYLNEAGDGCLEYPGFGLPRDGWKYCMNKALESHYTSFPEVSYFRYKEIELDKYDASSSTYKYIGCVRVYDGSEFVTWGVDETCTIDGNDRMTMSEDGNHNICGSGYDQVS